MSNNISIVEDFIKQESIYKKFRDNLDYLSRDILTANNIIPHQIICRLKEQQSLANKISRKKDKYNSLGDITDLVGLRIICYFEDEVDKIATIIEKEFEIDPNNSIDKRVLEDDKFGYRSLHYVVSLSKERLRLTENKYFSNLKAEIQVRSILQHAWAEIEHDIGYKGEVEIPKFAKRSFYRIAALLETADIEFVKLKDTLKKYESEITKSIKRVPEKVLLDKASLNNYIQNSLLVKKIELNIKSLIGSNIIDKDYDGSDLTLPRLIYLEVNTIKELEQLLEKYQNQIPLFVKIFGSQAYKSGMPSGISLFYLAYIVASKDKDLVKLNLFCKKFGLSEDVPQTLIDCYENSIVTI